MYVTGYVIAVPEEKKKAYVAMVKIFAEVAKEFDAIDIFENWELKVPDGEHTDYRQAVKALPGEKIVFSWIAWPDRETDAIAHKGMWVDPGMEEIDEIPLDRKRMIMGGFEPILAFQKA